ncbi:MAG: type I methionyl aminopeptidase [Actinobacteria bacterium]|nr:MAG: type I methionyl aminopeptidase [Actinomycetota bacterium]
MSRIEIKTRQQMRWMREAGLVVAAIHKALREAARPGVTTAELDAVSAATIRDAGATSNFYGYMGYPATVCIAVNDVVVHGIPGEQVLRPGDIVSFDCGAYIVRGGKQWHGDAAFTMVIGDELSEIDCSPETLQRRHELEATTREAMWAALASLATARRINAVGNAVEEVVERKADAYGWEAGIVEEYTGHGIGTQMHQAPEVVNYRSRGFFPKVKPGMALAIEPMLVTGSIDTIVDPDGWTVRTTDGGDAAQWEHSVAILEDGISVLTAPDGGKEGLAPFGITPVNLDDE